MRRGRSRTKNAKTSRYTGVTLFSAAGAYQAFVKIRGRRIHLGMWRSERDAAIARDRAVIQFGLEGVSLNLPRASSELGPASPEALVALARRRSKEAGASSLYIGVTWDSQRRRWAAVICVGDRRAVQIAQFDREKDAAIAYDRVARRLFPNRTVLNFPNETHAPASMQEMRREARRLYKQRTSSKYRGVAWDKHTGWWRALVTCRGRPYRLGQFPSERLAARAYDRAAAKLFGAGAILNFPR